MGSWDGRMSSESEPSEGAKNDAEKWRWDLLPWDAVEEVVKVLTYGARKYSVDNWKLVPRARDRYFSAAMRHLVAWRKGEKVDGEWGFSHLAHAICCLIFLLWMDGNDSES